jgi:hypothetical protein
MNHKRYSVEDIVNKLRQNGYVESFNGKERFADSPEQ